MGMHGAINSVKATKPPVVVLGVGVGLALAGVIVKRLQARRRRKRRRKAAVQSQAEAFISATSATSNTQDYDDASRFAWHEAEAEQAPPAALQETLFNEQLPLSVEALWDEIFKANAELPLRMHRLKCNKDLTTGRWQQQGSQLVRHDQYVTPLRKNRLGPSEAQCFEQLACHHRGQHGFLVTKQVATPGVPFGKAFHCSLQWLAKAEGPQHSRLRVSCQVDFHGTVGPLRGTIRNASLEGMREHHVLFLQQLQEAAQQRSPRKPTSAGSASDGGMPALTVRTRGPVGGSWAAGLARWWLAILAALLFFALLGLSQLNSELLEQLEHMKRTSQPLMVACSSSACPTQPAALV